MATKKKATQKTSFDFELPKALDEQRVSAQGELQEFSSDLEGFIAEARLAYDNKSEAWQNSDRGQEVDDWLSELEQLLEDCKELESRLYHDFPENP